MNKIPRIAARHWKLLALFNATVLAATTVNIRLTPKVWTTKAELILPNVTSNLDADLGKLGNYKDGGVVFSQQINPLKILSSIVMSDRVIKKVWESDPERNAFDQLTSYKSNFTVSPQSESTVISLSVEGSSPELALKRAQGLIASFQDRLQELRQDEALGRSQFMYKEVKQAQIKLNIAQKSLSEFKETSNLVSSEEQTKNMVAAINTLNTERSQVIAEASSNGEQVKILSSRLSLTPNTAIRSTRLEENKEYQFTRQKLSEVEAALTEAEGKLTAKHPRVLDLTYQRDVLRGQIQEHVANAAGNVKGINTTVGDNTSRLIQQLVLAESEEKANQKKAEQLQIQIDKLTATLKTFPGKQSKLQQLQRQYDIAEGLYNGVVAQTEQAKLGAFSTYPSVQILDKPMMDYKPSGPKLNMIVLGAILASGFGSAGIILLMESRNPLLGYKEIYQTKIPVLGSVPYVRSLATKIDREGGGEIEFQRLASAVSLMHLETGRLMIASASSQEGKTTTTLGLGIALINLGFKVLIVDGDFRKTQLSQYLGYQQRLTLDSELLPVNMRPGLDLLSLKMAPEKIAEFVARGRFERRLNLAQATGNYDYVLIDSPAVSLTSEAALMAKVACNVLFVTRPGKSDRNPFCQSIEELTRHQARILGFVVNGREIQAQSYVDESNQVEIAG
jgi:polysaccharide biosynthesis transport protein